jgi:hypothetical protein
MLGRINWLIDTVDRFACKLGMIEAGSWQDVLKSDKIMLYAGRLSRGAPQFGTHFGLTPYAPSSRNIPHDLTKPFPLPDGSVQSFQAEDVFEHIPYERLTIVFDEIYRVLVPGGLFRLSVPDFRNPTYMARCQRGPDGEIIFDPGGGGQLKDGRVLNGGHVWFPTYELVRDLFDKSKFAIDGEVRFLHYTDLEGKSVVDPIDYSLGYVQRTPDHDIRMKMDHTALSIVVDAVKR